MLALPPKYFGKKIEKHVLAQLRAKVEGKCSGRFGFTIVVTSLQDIGSSRPADPCVRVIRRTDGVYVCIDE